MTNNNFKDSINDLIKNALKEVAPNMTINDKNTNVQLEKEVEATIQEALNASQEDQVITASLDGFKLADKGDGYLLVSHAVLNCDFGLLGQNEYSNSKDKSQLLQIIAKDSFRFFGSANKTINFTGSFVEPVIEKAAAGCDQCDSAGINGVFCHETGCPNESKKCRHGKMSDVCSVCSDPMEMESKVAPEKSWLGGDLMSEDPEPYADSEQIDENEKYVLWSTPYADHTSYWVSDKEGFELATFNTEEEARNAMATGQGLEMVEEASVAIKPDESGKSHMTDHLAQSIQAEEQVITAANDKIKTEAVNALVSMLNQAGYGSAKVAEVSMVGNKIDAMVTLDDAGTIKAVNIPVEIKANKMVLPKRSLVAELISKGLDLNAKLSEEFGKQVLERIAAADEKADFEKAEAESIINEKVASLEKVAGDEPKTQFEGTNEQVILNKHLIPVDASDLEIGDTVHIDGISYKLVSKSKDVLSKGEDDGSQWTFEKVTPISK